MDGRLEAGNRGQCAAEGGGLADLGTVVGETRQRLELLLHRMGNAARAWRRPISGLSHRAGACDIHSAAAPAPEAAPQYRRLASTAPVRHREWLRGIRHHPGWAGDFRIFGAGLSIRVACLIQLRGIGYEDGR